MTTLRLAIVGAGPAGIYAADILLKEARGFDVSIDLFEQLPAPYGLVRYGVAPDHPKIKTISAQFEKVASDPRFRFFGNIRVGDDVRADELAERYDAVIYAVGAQADRPLGIPGEELPGSVAAVDFVGWYNAHPHFEEMAPDLSTGRADAERTAALLEAYTGVRPLTGAERVLLPAMLRAAALRFWISRLWDFHLPREASMLKAHDPTHFERVLRERVRAPQAAVAESLGA